MAPYLPPGRMPSAARLRWTLLTENPARRASSRSVTLPRSASNASVHW